MFPYSGDLRRSPPPLPPHTSFHSLSPSAAPFTVDRSHPSDPVPNPDPNPSAEFPTAPSLYAAGAWGGASWMDPPASYMAPRRPAAPGYKANPDGSVFSENILHDIYSREPHPSESSGWISEKFYQGSAEGPSSGLKSSVFGQHSLVGNVPDSLRAKDTLPCPMRQPLNQYPASSTYDNCMTTAIFCTTDPLTNTPSIPYAASSELCGSGKRMTSAMDDIFLESSFSFAPYMNPCRINLDYFDNMWNEQKDLGYRTADKQYGAWSNSAGSMTTMASTLLSSLGENYSADESVGTGKSVQHSSEMKFDLRNLQPTYSMVSPSDVGFLQPCKFDSESVEVNNLVVDSPCWKGSPAAHEPLFGGVKNNDISHAANITGDNSDSHQYQKFTEFSTKNLRPFSKHQEATISKDDHSLTYGTGHFSPFILPVNCKKSEDCKELPPFGMRVRNDMGSHTSYVSEEQHAKIEKCTSYDSGENSNKGMNSNQQESFLPVNRTVLLGENIDNHVASIAEESTKKASSHIGAAHKAHAENLTKGSLKENIPYLYEATMTEEIICSEMPVKEDQDHSFHYNPDVEENMANMSSDRLTSSSKAQSEFLKSMHNLSIMFLSTCNDGSSLEKSEEAVIQSVIQNLRTFISQKSKVELKANDGMSNSSQAKLKSMDCTGKSSIEKPVDPVPVNIDADFKTFVSQAFTKVPKENLFADTEASEAMIYKNLWIEAEAAVCKLKYDLQLTRVKLAMKGHNYKQTVPIDLSEDKASDLTMSKSLSHIRSLEDCSKPQNQVKEIITCTASMMPQVDDNGNRNSPEVNRSIADGVDAAVFARLEVLESRDNNMNSLYEDNSKQLQEVSKKKTDVVDDAVMARLRVLKSRDDNINSSDEGSTKQQLEESKNREDGVDDAVMTRLRVLKCRNDYKSSLNEDSSELHETSNNRSDGLEDGVMDRLRVLKGRIDNTTSIAKGHLNLLHSDNLAGHLERNESAGGLFGSNCFGENESGMVNSATDIRHSTLSDDVDSKTAVQHLSSCQNEDGLAVKHAWPDAAARSHASTTESPATLLHEEPQSCSVVHPSGASPSEWEHVLKEDFFLPGYP